MPNVQQIPALAHQPLSLYLLPSSFCFPVGSNAHALNHFFPVLERKLATQGGCGLSLPGSGCLPFQIPPSSIAPEPATTSASGRNPHQDHGCWGLTGWG